MAYPQYTANQAIRYPISSDSPDVPTHLLNALTDVETRLVMRFSSASDRSTKITTPVEGMLASLATEGTLTYYDGTAWQQIWPVAGHQTVGTTVPDNATGSNGDVYYKV